MAVIGIWASITIFILTLAFFALVLLERAWRAAGELIFPPKRSPASAPTDYGLDFQTVKIRTRDGLELRGWWIPATPTRGTIVFSHGYAGDCSPDLKYAPLFHEAGFNVFLFDYRGHGASQGDWTSLVYFERSDLLAALDFLRTLGIARVGLIGFSMGGAIALSTSPLSPMVVGTVSDSTFAELKSIVRNAAIVRRVPPPLASVIGWLVVALASIRLRANLFSADPIHWVGKISPCPVLIMHGAADEGVPVSEAYRLYNAAREPKELWIVPGANHREIEAVAAEEYRRRVVQFFEQAFADANGN